MVDMEGRDTKHTNNKKNKRHEVADSHFRLLDPPEGLNIDSVNQVLCKLIRGQAFAGAHRETSYHAHEQSDQATLEALVARGLVERVGLSDYKILKVCLDRMGLVTVLHSPVFPLVSPQSLPFSEMTTYQLADVLIQKGWAFKDYKHRRELLKVSGFKLGDAKIVYHSTARKTFSWHKLACFLTCEDIFASKFVDALPVDDKDPVYKSLVENHKLPDKRPEKQAPAAYITDGDDLLALEDGNVDKDPEHDPEHIRDADELLDLEDGDSGDDEHGHLEEPGVSAPSAPAAPEAPEARKSHGRDLRAGEKMEWLPGMFFKKKRYRKRWIAWEAHCLYSTPDLPCIRARSFVQPPEFVTQDPQLLEEFYESDAFLASQAMVLRQLKHWCTMCNEYGDRYLHMDRSICPLTEEHNLPADDELEALGRLELMRFQARDASTSQASTASGSKPTGSQRRVRKKAND